MKFEPVKYKIFERIPIGCFEAQMTANGWAESKYTNDTSSVLFSSEISEFVRLVDFFFKQCPDLMSLDKYAKKHGQKIPGDGYEPKMAINFLCDKMDYTLHITGNTINIFPYRKFQH